MPEPSEMVSLWSATAVEAEPGQQLAGDVSCQVAVVGAGFTGLVAALRLAMQGFDVHVLEAHDAGFGASGRNGGQIIPGLKAHPDRLAKIFGATKAAALWKETEGSAAAVMELIRIHQIDCQLEHCGFFQPALNRKALAASISRGRRAHEAGAEIEVLGKHATADLLGSDRFIGGVMDKRGGLVQPLSLARGLARAASEQGAHIWTQSAATELVSVGDKWQLQTKRGSVTAEKVLLCTNAYTDNLWPDLHRSIIPIYSFQIATRPLTAAQRAGILPQQIAVSNSQRLLNYFRFDSDGRFLFGGRGGSVDALGPRNFQHLTAGAHKFFPQLKDVPIAHYWSGRVALTADGVPHIHTLAPGVFTGIGLNGRGVAMTTLMGGWLADLAADKEPSPGALPVTPFRPLKYYGFRNPILRAATLAKSLQDRLGL